MFGRNRARRRVEAIEHQLASVLEQVREVEDRRTSGEQSARAELADASARHEADLHALRDDLARATARLAEQDALRERLTNDLTDLVASLSARGAKHGEQVAEMRQLLGRRLERGAGKERSEQAGANQERDDLLLLQSSAIKVLHVDIERLSRRLELDAEEAARTAAALMERIEHPDRTAARSRDGGASIGGART